MRYKNDFIMLWMPVIIIALLFIAVSYAAQQYIEPIKTMIQQNSSLAVLSYIVILVAAIVIVPLPINTILLVPIAANVWGAFFAGLLSVIGWTIGAMISFILARRYGRPLMARFVSLEKIERIEKRIPATNLFWSVVFLRMALPVDLLSYALGLFTTMGKTKYFLATIIGVSPFAFLMSYTGTFSVWYQVVIIAATTTVFLFGFYFVKKKWPHRTSLF